jgi:hypothetical protein
VSSPVRKIFWKLGRGGRGEFGAGVCMRGL